MKKILLSLVAIMALFTAKAAEITLWEGEAVVDAWSDQPTFLSDTGTELKEADAAAGDIVRFYVSSFGEGWQIQLIEGHWGPRYAYFSSEVLYDEETGELIEGVEVLDFAETPYFDLTLTDEILEAAYTQKWWGGVFLLNGTGNVIVNKLTLVKEGDLPEWEAEGKSISFDEYGQILSSEFNGYTDDAKVEFTFTTTGAGSFVGWGAGSLKSIDGSVDIGENFSVKGDGTYTVSYKLGALKEALNAGPDEYGRYGITWGMWDFGDGSCTNQRVSVVIRELIGATGEKYVAPVAAAPLYVIGDVEGSSWTPNDGSVTLTYDATNDVYTGIITVKDSWEGNGWFAFTTALGADENDWTTLNANRLTVSSDYGTLDETATLVTGVDQSFKLAAGEYGVIISLTNMTIKFTTSAGIAGTAISAATPAAYYSISGARLAAPQKGVNVVKLSNGQVKKVFIK